MTSTNTSRHPIGCVSIPVEIVSNSQARTNCSFQKFHHEYPYSDFSNSPPWKKSLVNEYKKDRTQPRSSVTNAYDRLINNSQYNQPLKTNHPLYQPYQEPLYRHAHQGISEPKSLHISRSSEDFLSTTTDSIRPSNQPQNTSFHPSLSNYPNRRESDFLQLNEDTSSFRRSHDALNDRPIYQYEPSEKCQQDYSRPISVKNHSSDKDRGLNKLDQQAASEAMINSSHDRSRSPNSQRGESPTRPPRPPSSNPERESDFKVTDQTTSQTSQSNDQQVPSTDPPIPRDPNLIALEKLEQIKQNLANLNEQVELFSGLTRDDRIYKLLDEQAVNIMMRCDELTNVSADIKEKRKEMIRNVQTVLAKLESKVPTEPSLVQNSNSMETALVVSNLNTQNLPIDETSIEQSS